MTEKYFYSPDLDECAGCGGHMALVNNFGVVVLDAPGAPHLYYTLCAKCAPLWNPERNAFVAALEQRLLARAVDLGAYTTSSHAHRGIGE